MMCHCRESDAGLTYVGTTWNIYDKLLAGLFKSWRSYLQLPKLKFHVVQVLVSDDHPLILPWECSV